VTVFTESTTSDASEHASQSVPMVTTSTGTLSTTNETAAGDDGDEVFVEAESEGYDFIVWFLFAVGSLCCHSCLC
jgi:nucleoprotein TPR